ncbi:MAG: alpha/beta hydrolase [Anaerolineae bacterium]|nr:alpha/beta hydrolase [Anaerolineae bacterium]
MAINLDTLDGLEFAAEVTGDGPPILLLHGWGGRIESMQAVAAGLVPHGFQAHILDLPGFGRSAAPPQTPEPWGVFDYTEFVRRYMDKTGLPSFHVIGHSFGGRIGILLGANHPERVGKLVLADSAGVLTPPSARSRLVELGKAALKLPGLSGLEPQLRKLGQRALGSDDLKSAGALEATFRKVVTEDLLPYAARIKAPTLLIWGDLDQDTPLWQGQALEKTIPDAGLVVFKGAGHFAYQERLTEFVHIVKTFLQGKA